MESVGHTMQPYHKSDSNNTIEHGRGLEDNSSCTSTLSLRKILKDKFIH